MFIKIYPGEGAENMQGSATACSHPPGPLDDCLECINLLLREVAEYLGEMSTDVEMQGEECDPNPRATDTLEATPPKTS